jgi:hypothetical protein
MRQLFYQTPRQMPECQDGINFRTWQRSGEFSPPGQKRPSAELHQTSGQGFQFSSLRSDPPRMLPDIPALFGGFSKSSDIASKLSPKGTRLFYQGQRLFYQGATFFYQERVEREPR